MARYPYIPDNHWIRSRRDYFFCCRKHPIPPPSEFFPVASLLNSGGLSGAVKSLADFAVAVVNLLYQITYGLIDGFVDGQEEVFGNWLKRIHYN